jgi:hypothetical protein
VAPFRTELLDALTLMMAVVDNWPGMLGTFGFHPEIEPSSDTKIKEAASPAASTAKSCWLPLNTMPVGVPCADPGEPGIVTTSGWICPFAEYAVDVPVPLLATHHGPSVDRARPQGLTRFGSLPATSPGGAIPPMIRFVWRYL